MEESKLSFLTPLNLEKEFFTDERCHILELLNNHSDAPFSIARARVEPGITTAWHRLSETVEYYYILEGSGWMEIGEDKSFLVGKGDLVTIPSNAAQRISNQEIDRDLLFLAICTPAFKDRIYETCE